MPGSVQLMQSLWGIGIGIVFSFAIWAIVSNAWYRQATEDRIPDTDVKPTPIGIVEEYPEGLGEAHGGPTFFLKVLAGAWFLWMLYYVANFVVSNGNTTWGPFHP